MVEIIKKPNNNIVVDNRRLNINLHKHYHISKPNKPTKYKTNTIQKACMICKTMKRMSPNSQFCSQRCLEVYRKYKKDKLKRSMKEFYEEKKEKWYKFW